MTPHTCCREPGLAAQPQQMVREGPGSGEPPDLFSRGPPSTQDCCQAVPPVPGVWGEGSRPFAPVLISPDGISTPENPCPEPLLTFTPGLGEVMGR